MKKNIRGKINAKRLLLQVHTIFLAEVSWLKSYICFFFGAIFMKVSCLFWEKQFAPSRGWKELSFWFMSTPATQLLILLKGQRRGSAAKDLQPALLLPEPFAPITACHTLRRIKPPIYVARRERRANKRSTDPAIRVVLAFVYPAARMHLAHPCTLTLALMNKRLLSCSSSYWPSYRAIMRFLKIN